MGRYMLSYYFTLLYNSVFFNAITVTTHFQMYESHICEVVFYVTGKKVKLNYRNENFILII